MHLKIKTSNGCGRASITPFLTRNLLYLNGIYIIYILLRYIFSCQWFFFFLRLLTPWSVCFWLPSARVCNPNPVSSAHRLHLVVVWIRVTSVLLVLFRTAHVRARTRVTPVLSLPLLLLFLFCGRSRGRGTCCCFCFFRVPGPGSLFSALLLALSFLHRILPRIASVVVAPCDAVCVPLLVLRHTIRFSGHLAPTYGTTLKGFLAFLASFTGWILACVRFCPHLV